MSGLGNDGVVTCYKCGMTFALDPGFFQLCKSDKRTFYCPNGHGNVLVENDQDKLRKELEAAKLEILNLRKRVEAARSSEEFWKERATKEPDSKPSGKISQKREIDR